MEQSRLSRLLHVVVVMSVTAVATADQASEPSFVCGVNNAEDLVRLAGTSWLVASHFNPDVTSGMPPTRYGFGPLQAVHIDTHKVSILYPAPESKVDWDKQTYPDCSAPPTSISSHGLGARQIGENRFRLYAINHDGRHSVEVIDVDAAGVQLRATWRGCVDVSMEKLNVWPNAVAPLPDDGFILSGYNVATWKPKRGWEKFTDFQGTNPGEPYGHQGRGYANGVQVSPSGQWVFIADMQRKAVYRFPMDGGEPTVIPLPVGRDNLGPDNLKWGDDGRLYAATPVFPKEWHPDTVDDFVTCFQRSLCVTGTFVAAIDIETLDVEVLVRNEDGFKGRHGLTSTALPIANNLWLTSERSECLAVLPFRPR